MGKPYRECPWCGDHLDAGEICECRKETVSAGLVVICREIDKATGKIAVYPVDSEINGVFLSNLKIRARMNPEFRYFATTAAHFQGCRDVITAALKRRTVTQDSVSRVGGIVEL